MGGQFNSQGPSGRNQYGITNEDLKNFRDSAGVISASLTDLGLSDVPFPEGFVPRYKAMSEAEGYVGIWHVFDDKPKHHCSK